MYILLLKCVFAKFTINNIFCVHMCTTPCMSVMWLSSREQAVKAPASPWKLRSGTAGAELSLCHSGQCPLSHRPESRGLEHKEVQVGTPLLLFPALDGAAGDPASLLHSTAILIKRTARFELELASRKAQCKLVPVSSQPTCGK